MARTRVTKDYFMDSGLFKNYPTTGIAGQPTGNVNYKYRLGTKCTKCGQEFRDGDVARRTKGGFGHEACPYHGDKQND